MLIDVVCTAGDHFLRPIVEHLAERHTVRRVDPRHAAVSDGHRDLLWVEWANEAAVHVLSRPSSPWV